MRYFGHVEREREGDEEEPVKKAMLMPVTGRSVGRQTIRWKDVLKRDMNKLGLQEENAMNRKRRKHFIRVADHTTQWE